LKLVSLAFLEQVALQQRFKITEPKENDYVKKYHSSNSTRIFAEGSGHQRPNKLARLKPIS